MATNDLIDFINATSVEIEQEYYRIQKRVKDDPGTAGDQGEENWATIFKSWLPPNFQVVTKGRILSHDGIASPQVDVIILRPEYPTKLLDKKLYLAGGVLAAFECKLTLRLKHLEKFFQNSVKIKGLTKTRIGTPYKELQSPILFGLLAHSHNIEKTPDIKIDKKILDMDKVKINHPIYMPDIICVANIGTWISSKFAFINKCDAITSYIFHSKENKGTAQENVPIGSMLIYLMQKLGWEYSDLRSLSRYFTLTNIQGGGKGLQRQWKKLEYSNDLFDTMRTTKIKRQGYWNEWNII